MRTETLSYQADGLEMRSQLFFQPATRPRAGVLVFPESFGLGPHTLARAERLAGMGYAALACDIHGNGRLISDLQQASGLLAPLYADTSRMRARGMAALAALAARTDVDAGRIASIGFCFGGTLSLELARGGADLKAVVGFHCGLKTTAPKGDTSFIKARILVCIGADDPFIPPAERATFETEMREAKADWQMHLYGGTVHSFTHQEADRRGSLDVMRYSAEADMRSWTALEQMFSETLQ